MKLQGLVILIYFFAFLTGNLWSFVRNWSSKLPVLIKVFNLNLWCGSCFNHGLYRTHRVPYNQLNCGTKYLQFLIYYVPKWLTIRKDMPDWNFLFGKQTGWCSRYSVELIFLGVGGGCWLCPRKTSTFRHIVIVDNFSKDLNLAIG